MTFELYLVSFNCARNFVTPDYFAPPLFDAFPATAPSLPDVLAISLQEVAPIAYSFLGGSYLDPYFDRIHKTVQLAVNLRSNGSDTLEHVATKNLGMTALMIFAKPQFIEGLQWLESADAGVGFWNMGNKGAVAVRLGHEDFGVTLTAAHLAPHEIGVQDRNKDWEAIVRNLVFLGNNSSGNTAGEEQPLLSSSSSAPSNENGLYDPRGQFVFFAGDLNYRTRDIPPTPDAYRSYPQPEDAESSPRHFRHLLEGDQLTRERLAHRTLHGFEEQPITFPPTYKYSHRHVSHSGTHKRTPSDISETWRWAKHRMPSWCDRILYLHPPPSSIFKSHNYIALPIQPTSDHRPVALSLQVKTEGLNTQSVTETRQDPPFPINPNWRARRDSARRLEVVVGVLAYFTLTKKGNAVLVAVAGVAFAGWWMGQWLQSK